MATKFEICSKALIELGEDTINSFLENTSRSRICGLIYPDYIKYLITLHPWSFSMKKVQLAQLVTKPVNVWRFAYQLPSDILLLRAVYDNGNDGAIPTTNYTIVGDQLHTNNNLAFIKYQMEVSSEKFPQYFQEFVVKALASKLALPITDSKTMVQQMEQRAFGLPSDNRNGGEFGIAKRLDSFETPNSFIPADDLLAARIGTGTSYYRGYGN